MADPKAYQQIVHVSTNSGTRCPICKNASIGGSLNFEAGINHLLKEHGGLVLHVGTEDVPDDSAKAWHTTVAVIGIPEDPFAGAS